MKNTFLEKTLDKVLKTYYIIGVGYVMATNKNKQKLSTTINKSIITKLRDQSKLDDSLLVLISNLTLEDLIAIKLELSCDLINNRLYGFDIWRNSNKIVQEAILKFAISTTKSKKDAARFLDLTYLEFKKLLRKYEVESYFEDV